MNYVFLKRFSYNLFTKTLLLFRISLLKCFIYRRVKTSKILRGATIPSMLTKNQVKTISVNFIKKKLPSSPVIYCLLTRKTSHKKNHADKEHFTCFLKKCSYLQHISQSGHSKLLKLLSFFWLFFFMVIFLVNSPTSKTTFIFQHS